MRTLEPLASVLRCQSPWSLLYTALGSAWNLPQVHGQASSVLSVALPTHQALAW